MVELWLEFNNTLSAITACGNKFDGTHCFSFRHLVFAKRYSDLEI